jgi:hypothetical protein
MGVTGAYLPTGGCTKLKVNCPGLRVLGSALGKPPTPMWRVCARSNSGKPRLPRKASQFEVRVRVPPDEGPHLAGQVERLGSGGNYHDRLTKKRFANLRPTALQAQGKSDRW